ncbi:MAG: PepSY domain-containing protein, partial [Synergistaceae bacterium]|nr:PepSY domain-containing protein [Synergistaceae bacterium]
ISSVSIKQYEKHGTKLYDITFSAGGAKYNYEIDANSAEIMEYKHRNTGGRLKETNGGSQDYIGYEKAKSIALAHANISESDIRKYEAELDRNHGRAVYEIEFNIDRTEYEYEIDAVTGEIMLAKSEYD